MSEIELLGKKIGMTREFYKTGQSVPVTVLKMETGRVIQVIEQDKRGYKAVQVGFGNIKTSKISKATKVRNRLIEELETCLKDAGAIYTKQLVENYRYHYKNNMTVKDRLEYINF